MSDSVLNTRKTDTQSHMPTTERLLACPGKPCGDIQPEVETAIRTRVRRKLLCPESWRSFHRGHAGYPVFYRTRETLKVRRDFQAEGAEGLEA